MTMRRRVPALLAFLSLAACQAGPSSVVLPPAHNAIGEPVDPHARDRLGATLWMRDAAEFEACCRQAFVAASRTLAAAAADAKVAALPNTAGDGARLAVITDLDETMVDNLLFQEHQVRDGVDFGDAGWTAWVNSGRAGLLPGAAEFLREALAMPQVDVFYISNRTTPDHVAGTLATLRDVDAKLANEPQRLLLKVKGGSSDKSARRAQVAKDRRVVLLLGDDLGDFVSVPKVDATHGIEDVVKARRQLVADAGPKWGTTWIVLPNPSYGSWSRVYESPDLEIGHRQRLDRLRGTGAWAPPAPAK